MYVQLYSLSHWSAHYTLSHPYHTIPSHCSFTPGPTTPPLSRGSYPHDLRPSSPSIDTTPARLTYCGHAEEAVLPLAHVENPLVQAEQPRQPLGHPRTHRQQLPDKVPPHLGPPLGGRVEAVVVAGGQVNHALEQGGLRVGRPVPLQRLHVALALLLLLRRRPLLHVTIVVVVVNVGRSHLLLHLLCHRDTAHERLQTIRHALDLLNVRRLIGQSKVEHFSVGRRHNRTLVNDPAVGLQRPREELGDAAVVPK